MGATKKEFNNIREGEIFNEFSSLFYDGEGKLKPQFKDTILGTEDGFFLTDEAIHEIKTTYANHIIPNKGYSIPPIKGITLKPNKIK